MITRRRVYEIVQVAAPGDSASRIFDLTILTLIVLNVCAIIAETIQPLYLRYASFFRGFETLSVAVFTLEYALRLWACVSSPDFSRPVVGRLRFAVTSMAVVDLLAILPFYLPFFGLDLRFIRIVRLLRFFRVAKLARYLSALGTLRLVLKAKKQELLICVSLGAILLVLTSSLMYYVEPTRFASIPGAMWWGVATLTTVGYGDTVPITPLGKLLGGVVAILGIGMFALPTAILGGGFVEELQKRSGGPKLCPHCGREIPSV